MDHYAFLDEEQEQQLACRWRDFRDQHALHALVKSHLRLAAKMARHYRGYGLPLADIIAEANVGLVIAASRFEPGRGSRFSTYAQWWIKSCIHDYILRSWSLVKIGTTGAQRKLFFRLRSEMRKVSGAISLGPETADLVAHNLGVTAGDVIEMDSRLRGDFSLNKPIGDEDGRTVEWESMLVDESPDAEVMLAERDETAQQASALSAALEELTHRERLVFEARRLTDNPRTLAELADDLELSPERVRQIESTAFKKVKRATLARMQMSQSRPCEFGGLQSVPVS